MRRLKLIAHLTSAELERQYRQATDPVARSQWQIVWLLTLGQPTETVAASTGYSKTWIYTIVQRYNQASAAGIGDRRHANPGGKPLLSPDLAAELDAALDQPPSDGGVWTSTKVASWMSSKLGRAVHVPRGWEALQRLGLRPKVPRPRHVQADAEAQVAFQKKVPEALATVQAAYPDQSVEVWTMDEHRIGLKPILRKVWCRNGQRPVVPVQHRYEWLYVYGFVRPTTGDTYWLLLPTVSSAAFTLALQEFAHGIGAGVDKQIVLVLDQAGWHRSKHVVVTVGLHVTFLPPSSPELQPAERVWTLTDEALVNRHFATLDELQIVQAERCRTLRMMPTVIQAHTLFHWWPRDTL